MFLFGGRRRIRRNSATVTAASLASTNKAKQKNAVVMIMVTTILIMQSSICHARATEISTIIPAARGEYHFHHRHHHHRPVTFSFGMSTTTLPTTLLYHDVHRKFPFLHMRGGQTSLPTRTAPKVTSPTATSSSQQQQQRSSSSPHDPDEVSGVSTKEMIDSFLTRDSRNSFIGKKTKENDD